MSYTKFAVRGTLIVLVISVFAGILGYIVRLVMARNLSIEEFGLFYAVFAFLSLLGVFKTFGFDKALIKFIPEFHHGSKNNLIKSSIIYVLFTQIVTNSIIIILVYLFSNYLSIHFFHSPKAGIALKLMAIAFFIDSFVNVLKFVFQGFKKVVLFALIDIVRMSVILMILIIGLKMNFGLFSPIFAYIIAPIILLISFGWIFVKNVFPQFLTTSFAVNKKLIKDLSRYGIFVMLSGTAAIVLGYTDSTILTYFKGVKDVALYNVALPTAKILINLPIAIGSVLLPLASELWTKKKHELLKAGIESLYKYSFLISFPLVLIMLSFSNLIISVLFGKEYILAANAMRILSIGMVFYTYHFINVNFFLGIGQPQIQSKILYAAAAFNIITDIMLIPMFGIIGAAITTTASFLIMMILGFMQIKNFITINLPVRMWIRALLAGSFFLAIVALLKNLISLNVWLETAVVLAIAGLAYIAILFLLKVIDFGELKELHRKVFK